MTYEPLNTHMLSRDLGKRAYLPVSRDMQVEVVVVDIKILWGDPTYLVKPVAGKGTQWSKSIHFTD